ncbi:15-hydroxyprostaglandin dehydrogenase [Dactylonectria estremocensis]|uniref:15-hydroxyprostaglandin dehydrogenase n=1 Tax=Dactylonectria estremocensis TaxID=1079267 RepID=A0A9P9IW38_9HYPO|nr:15-hydroxyprostaglandin dehydrogenase [Dactylonectria estremocensis]
MENSSLIGKSIIVTGGASGVGLALVKFFAAAHGTQIGILDISPASAETLLPSLQAEFPNSKFSFKKCDISSWDEQAAVFKEIYSEFGSVDVVCANAGVSEIGKFLEVENGEPRRPGLKTLDINLIGTLYSIKLGVHYMRKNTSAQKGHIICTTSNAGLYPFPIAPMYGVTKHGVVGAVRSLATPLEADGIRINGVCPNCIATGLADDNLFSSMVITPMSTLISAIQEFTTNTSLTGITAEISGDKFTIRHPPEFVDDITKKNFDTFWALGYA